MLAYHSTEHMHLVSRLLREKETWRIVVFALMTVGNWIQPEEILTYTLITEDGTFAREIRRLISMERHAFQKIKN